MHSSPYASHQRDAFVYALFGAALLHGLLILGVTFDHRTPRPAANPLKVVLTPPSEERRETPPEEAAFSGAADLQESGTPDAAHHGGVVLPAAEQDAAGETDGDAPRQQETASERVPREQLVTPADGERRVHTPPDARPRQDPASIAARIQHASPRTAFQRRDLLQAQGPLRELEISVATRRSDVAAYMAVWKDHVEEVGTLYFPDAARQQRLSGSPVVEVSIGADGGLRSIEVVRPSPHPLLDQAALRILRLAAPFAPFPQALREDYDALRFVYEWRFVGGEFAP